ncbi:MAG: glycosyltransferase family 2 protein [Bacteroidota bacterium]
MLAKRPISAVVITKNEALTIRQCVMALQAVADEVLVYDSFSDDGTVEICKSLGVNFQQGEWQGYAATKNHADRLAKHDWILSIDADEILSPQLQTALREADLSDLGQVYELQRRVFYCGKRVRWGSWNPDWKPRLFNRQTAHWVGEYVHETLQYTREVKLVRLTGVCEHYTVQSVAQHHAQIEKFAVLKARQMYANGKTHSLLKPFSKAAWEFIKGYFLKLGFLDGWLGFQIARRNAYAKWLRYQKLKDLLLEDRE